MKVLLRYWIFQFRRKQLKTFLSVKFVTFRTETKVKENISKVSIVFWNIHFIQLYMKLRKSKEAHLNSMYFVGSALIRLDLRRPSIPVTWLTQPPVPGLCPECETAWKCEHPFHPAPRLGLDITIPPSLPLCLQWHVTW